MEWINIHTSILDSEPFADAEPIQRATWLSLLRYCCGQENNGVIRGCKDWADRKWQQLCGVTKEEAEQVCSLYRIEGEDLAIEFYPREKQAEIKAKRSAGKHGGKKRADNASRSASSTNVDALGNSLKSASSTNGDVLGNSLKSASSTNADVLENSFNGREGKGREWNGIEGNPRGVEDEAVNPVSESVSDETVIGFAAEWPGEMASGTPKIDPAWVIQWLARMNGRREWPGKWKRCLIAQWRADHRAFASGGSPGLGEKNAAGLSANVAAIERQKKLAALSEEEDALAYDVNALRQGNIEVPAEKTRRLAEIKRELVGLRTEGGK